MKILDPPKLYFDTNHLINIAKLRNGQLPYSMQKHEAAYAALNDYIRNRHFGLIFNPAARLEWVDGNATLESALEIAHVVESARLQYEIEVDKFVYLFEVLQELRHIAPGLRTPDFSVLHVRNPKQVTTNALIALRREVPGYFQDSEIPESCGLLPPTVLFGSITDLVKDAFNFKHQCPATYRERVDGSNAAYNHDAAMFRTRPQNSAIGKSEVLDWMKRYLKVDIVVNALNPDTDVDLLLQQVDAARCPSVNLYVKAYEKRIRAGNTAKENDGDDWATLSIVTYADVFLTERNLRSFLHQADRGLESKVTHDPSKAVRMLERWL